MVRASASKMHLALCFDGPGIKSTSQRACVLAFTSASFILFFELVCFLKNNDCFVPKLVFKLHVQGH